MIICTPIAGNALIPSGYVKSLLQNRLYPFAFHEGASIPDNRNALFERARIEGEDLLFIDSDMVFTTDHVKKMEEHLKTFDVVTGICVMGFPGNPPAIFKKTQDGYKPVETEDGLFEVDACGAAFLGISRAVLTTLTEPFTPLKHPFT